MKSHYFLTLFCAVLFSDLSIFLVAEQRPGQALESIFIFLAAPGSRRSVQEISAVIHVSLADFPPSHCLGLRSCSAATQHCFGLRSEGFFGHHQKCLMSGFWVLLCTSSCCCWVDCPLRSLVFISVTGFECFGLARCSAGCIISAACFSPARGRATWSRQQSPVLRGLVQPRALDFLATSVSRSRIRHPVPVSCSWFARILDFASRAGIFLLYCSYLPL
jgi:hypothetical protein